MNRIVWFFLTALFLAETPIQYYYSNYHKARLLYSYAPKGSLCCSRWRERAPYLQIYLHLFKKKKSQTTTKEKKKYLKGSFFSFESKAAAVRLYKSGI